MPLARGSSALPCVLLYKLLAALMHNVLTYMHTMTSSPKVKNIVEWTVTNFSTTKKTMNSLRTIGSCWKLKAYNMISYIMQPPIFTYALSLTAWRNNKVMRSLIKDDVDMPLNKFSTCYKYR